MTTSFQTIFYMALNFFASVGIININNLVFKTYGFPFSTLLTGIHFLFTFMGLVICNQLEMFTIKRVPIRKVIPLSLAFVGFVVFNNLSLQYNSIGFYQLMKVLTTPAIVIIQFLAYGVKVHPYLQAALVPVCVGVYLATSSDVQVNWWGTFHAIMGIITTSFYQIWVKKEQQDLQLDSYQLLYLQSPLSAVLVFLLSFYFEGTKWTEYEFNIPFVTAVLASSVTAFLVNLSIFLVIGKTSPIAYNVLGHFKLCVILLSGFLFFQEDANGWKLFGTFLTLIGVITYTHLQQNLASGWEARGQAAAAAAASVETTDKTHPDALTVGEQERLLGTTSLSNNGDVAAKPIDIDLPTSSESDLENGKQ